MVLENKINNISYGTVSHTHSAPTITSSRCPQFQRNQRREKDLEAGYTSDEPHIQIHTKVGLKRSYSAEMTQDVYQRQPLLSSKGEGWEMGEGEIHSDAIISYGSHVANGNAVIRNGTDIAVGINIKNSMTSVSSSSKCSENGMIRIELPPPHRDEPKFARENFKTVLSFFFVLFNWFLTTTSLALVHERVPDRIPLPDVFLDNVPEVAWALDVSEFLIIFATTSCMILLFFHKYRFIILRRIFFLLGILYLMRSITMYVTVLPVASKSYVCSPKSNHTNVAMITLRAIKLLVGMGLSINGQHVYCGDYIYSGHTVILTMAYLIIQEYTPRKYFPIHWVMWIVSVSGVILVMVAHGHYTVDVLIAYYVTTRLFWIYHTMADNQILKQRGPSNYLARIWWYRIFLYFERNVGEVIPCRYEWPLPWPRQFLSKYPDRDS